MGLAASQCRLLFITQRQNDVSAKMQKISMDRMCLARDEDDIETKYNRMLNATKYQNTNGTDISYNALMGAGAAQQGNFSVITDASNRVVLNQALANKFGLTAAEGDGAAFQRIHGDVNSLITKAEGTNAQNVIDQLEGVNPTPPTNPNELTKEDKENLDDFKANYGSYPNKSSKITTSNLLDKCNLGNLSGWDASNGSDINGHWPTNNLGELVRGNGANGDYIKEIADDNSASGTPVTQAKNNISILTYGIIDALAPAFGIKNTAHIKDKFKSTINDFGTVIATLGDDHSAKHTEDIDPAVQAQTRKDGVLFTKGTATSGTNRDWYYVNVGTLIEFIFQRMCRFCEGEGTGTDADYEGLGVYGTGCNADFWIVDSKFDLNGLHEITVNENGYNISEYNAALQSWMGKDPTDDMKKYLGDKSISDPEPEATTDPDTINLNLATYYTRLWNALSTSGWTTQSNETIQSNLNQGLYYISGTKISESDSYDPVKDEDAVEAAKHWYDVETKKIKRKEDAMDMENTKLQTEYQSLTSDMQSVQNIINANIQKSFTYCSQG